MAKAELIDIEKKVSVRCQKIASESSLGIRGGKLGDELNVSRAVRVLRDKSEAFMNVQRKLLLRCPKGLWKKPYVGRGANWAVTLHPSFSNHSK